MQPQLQLLEMLHLENFAQRLQIASLNNKARSFEGDVVWQNRGVFTDQLFMQACCKQIAEPVSSVCEK